MVRKSRCSIFLGRILRGCMFARVFLTAFFVLMSLSGGLATEADQIRWRNWTADVFATAAKEHKLVLLNLGAVWCHWCHVMDDVTYQDETVVSTINQHYVAVRVDEDAFPDLSRRYVSYGWPATIIFDANAVEIVKRRGYVEPEVMRVVLKESFESPTPNPNPTTNFPSSKEKGLTSAQRDAVLASVVYLYDRDNGGWGSEKKFLDPDVMEFSLGEVLENNRVFIAASGAALQAARNLFDPIWGGVYQYSETPDWKTPHFEKIISVQSTNIRSYGYAYELSGDAQYLDAANQVLKYIDAFMTSPSGEFYTSQDADLSQAVTGQNYYALSDPERRKLGLPNIDKNVYADENGAMISSLLVLYSATGDETLLDRALRAAQWLLVHRALPQGGGFAHGERNPSGPFLSDTLGMGRAMLDLYGATGDRAWLTEAKNSGQFILDHFSDKEDLGYFTADARTSGALKPYKQLYENIAAARFFNALSNYSHEDRYKTAAIAALRNASSNEAIRQHSFSPGLLLADDEMRIAPLHLTVVGPKDDASARALFKASLAVPPLYKQTEWLDPREGPLPGSDIEYPDQPRAAAYVCTKNLCSPPVFSVEALQEELQSQ
jgi:uncharacterized protein